MSMTRIAISMLCGAACLAAQAAPVIYPAKGQSAAQTDRDRVACFEWSKAQSGFDPMQAPAANGSTHGPAAPLAMRSQQHQRATFDRAFGACMEGRGYAVR
jgi:hypothetical protein